MCAKLAFRVHRPCIVVRTYYRRSDFNILRVWPLTGKEDALSSFGSCLHPGIIASIASM